MSAFSGVKQGFQASKVLFSDSSTPKTGAWSHFRALKHLQSPSAQRKPKKMRFSHFSKVRKTRFFRFSLCTGWLKEFQSPKMWPHPPFLGSRNPKKAIWKPENPVLHLKMPILGPFRAQFEAFLRGAVRGRKWGHLGRKIDFFSFDPESDLWSPGS